MEGDDQLIFIPEANEKTEKKPLTDQQKEKLLDLSLEEIINNKREKMREEHQEKSEGNKHKFHTHHKVVSYGPPKIIPLYLSDREVEKILNTAQCSLGLKEKAKLQVVLKRNTY